MRRDERVGSGRSHGARCCIVPVHGVGDDVGPVRSRGAAVLAHRRGLLVDRPDGAFGDRVQVVVVGRARRLVKGLLRTERLEHVRLELALVVAADLADARTFCNEYAFLSGHADPSVELSDDELCSLGGLGLGLEEPDEDVAGVLVHEEYGVLVAVDGWRERPLEVAVQDARLRGGSVERTRVRGLGDARCGAEHTRTLGSVGDVLGGVRGAVGEGARLVFAEMAATVHQLADVRRGHLGHVGG